MKNIIFILIFSLSLGSCENFVDILPKGKNIPSSVDDLAKILNNNNNIGGGGMNWFYMSDDPYLSAKEIQSMSTTTLNAYTWAPYQYTQLEKDSDWATHYSIIYYANYVIENINKVTVGVEYNKEETLGRALIHRAYSYWYLISAYAPHYDATTAASEAGVPMPLESNINKQYPRSTVARVYEQIFEDLQTAIDLKGLPDWRTYSTWPCRAAAYALLSRVYLYQKNWEEAANYAQKALTIHDELSDYNQFSMTDPNNAAKGLNGFEPNVVRDPEVVLSKAASNNFTDVMASDELIQCYDKARDLRFRYFFSNKTRYEVQLDGYMRVNENQTFNGIRMSEIYLNRIEALVRMGSNDNIKEARRLLEILRSKRYDANQPQALPEMSQADLLKEVLLERHRELRFTCFRWFDLKRLNTDPATQQTLTRRAPDGNLVTLAPDSHRYTWAIPLDIIKLNPQLTQNAR